MTMTEWENSCGKKRGYQPRTFFVTTAKCQALMLGCQALGAWEGWLQGILQHIRKETFSRTGEK